jgi:hypothetical protein
MGVWLLPRFARVKGAMRRRSLCKLPPSLAKYLASDLLAVRLARQYSAAYCNY